MQIGHVRYINILTWLRGFQVKLLYLVLFSLYPSLFWELRDKRNLKNLQFLPESLGAMLEYWYIERGLLRLLEINKLASVEKNKDIIITNCAPIKQKKAKITCLFDFCFLLFFCFLFFLLFAIRRRLRSHFKNSCFVFYRGFQALENNKSPRPTASGFHRFSRVWKRR